MPQSQDLNNDQLFYDLLFEAYRDHFGDIPQDEFDSAGVTVDLSSTAISGFLFGAGYSQQGTASLLANDGISAAKASLFFEDLAQRYASAVTLNGAAASAADTARINNLNLAAYYSEKSGDLLNTATGSANNGSRLLQLGNAVGGFAAALQMILGGASGGLDGLGKSASGVVSGAIAASLVGGLANWAARSAVITGLAEAVGMTATSMAMTWALAGLAAGWLGGKMGEAIWETGWLELPMGWLMDHGLGWLMDQGVNAYDALIDKLAALGLHLKDDTYRIVRYDPLALDLNGDGMVSTRADGNLSGPLFDFDADGYRTATGWIAPEDGLLVWTDQPFVDIRAP